MFVPQNWLNGRRIVKTGYENLSEWYAFMPFQQTKSGTVAGNVFWSVLIPVAMRS